MLLMTITDASFLGRLGGGTGDAEDVKKHVFFEPINWEDLYNRQVSTTWCTHNPLVYCTPYTCTVHYTHRTHVLYTTHTLHMYCTLHTPYTCTVHYTHPTHVLYTTHTLHMYCTLHTPYTCTVHYTHPTHVLYTIVVCADCTIGEPGRF